MKHTSKNTIRSKTAWTLIELLVAMVVFSILSIALFMTYKVGVDVWQRRSVYATIQADARRAMERMSREIHQAGDIVAFSGSTLSFNILKPDNSWVSIRYYLGGTDGRTLLRQEGGNVEVLANNISQLTFNQVSQRVVDIDMRVEKNDLLGQRARVQIESQVNMRNKRV
ncbi:MAG: prepilin-type N-terminal cleavage/methylation domain-containing protein [Candidatus Omnitrophica bacterium]|nr:prepilin-type N-terminal cleavage/methylation domain-containing protein [Candidatus Omnitrophota bacterium]